MTGCVVSGSSSILFASVDIASEQDKATKAAEAEIAKLAILAARKIVKTGEANDTGSSK